MGRMKRRVKVWISDLEVQLEIGCRWLKVTVLVKWWGLCMCVWAQVCVFGGGGTGEKREGERLEKVAIFIGYLLRQSLNSISLFGNLTPQGRGTGQWGRNWMEGDCLYADIHMDNWTASDHALLGSLWNESQNCPQGRTKTVSDILARAIMQ